MCITQLGSDPLYERKSIEWRTDVLAAHKAILHAKYPLLPRYSSLTVATPVYRLSPADILNTMSKLEAILALSIPEKTHVIFFFVVDNPDELDAVAECPAADCDASGRHFTPRQRLVALEKATPALRVRVNANNVGASASRTRAWNECHTNHILFLDDDVDVESDLLVNYVDRIQQHPEAAGFVGLSSLPYSPLLGPAAVHFAQTSYFWHAATNFTASVPWGVTANICFRFVPGIEFDVDFPKTGGGEDIDFCIRLREQCGGAPLLPAPRAQVTHPWWGGGATQVLARRHYCWALGDGILLSKHPRYTFWSFPNASELLAALVLTLPVLTTPMVVLLLLLRIMGVMCLSDTLATVAYVYYNYDEQFDELFVRYPRSRALFPIVMSGFVRRASELGQLVTKIRRHEFFSVCRRFDWFTGLNADSIFFQRHRDALHFLLNVSAIVLAMATAY